MELANQATSRAKLVLKDKKLNNLRVETSPMRKMKMNLALLLTEMQMLRILMML
jgi:hypothetical protein